ncbi:RNA-protein complex protein Nop10 [Salinirubellus salinus]|uniref:Ribosome biogenesis protein Nop10 n=1 Tax=Salinirubellus salinus TaxID=1364945 RepID=A0A9E7R469_9EURY|nr:RNA-protein complex protein Nop10 [Salinirubellus salinus]UWM55535.1 RNA-protein complex protein Nop10 [Salinirubellus salinus]
MTTSDIRVCADWRAHHDRPVYTLGDTCPACGGDAVQSSPARYNPEDPYGEYRRRAKRRAGRD